MFVVARSEVREPQLSTILHRHPAEHPANVSRLRAVFRSTRTLFQLEITDTGTRRAHHGVHGEKSEARSGMSRASGESCDLVAC